jgi:Lrp/AsnC family transcriptional regulator
VAVLDREKVGLNVLVFSHVKLTGHGRDALLKFEQAVRQHPEILECYTLMGETDFLLRIVCRDIKAYEAFFLDHLSRFPGVQSVHSSRCPSSRRRPHCRSPANPNELHLT